MRVRVAFTVDVTDEFRRALRFREGREGLATREEIVEHYTQIETSTDDDLLLEYEEERDATEAAGEEETNP